MEHQQHPEHHQNHHHSHHHHHVAPTQSLNGIFILSIILNGLFVLIEAGVGLWQ